MNEASAAVPESGGANTDTGSQGKNSATTEGRSSGRRRPWRQLPLLGRWLRRETDGGEEARLNSILSNESDSPGPETRLERKMLLNLLRLEGMRVDDVMVPRADIIAIHHDATRSEVMEAFRAGRHSRLPVFRETLDDPIGFVHLKDVVLNETEEMVLEKLVRRALFVPPSMPMLSLFQRMQATRVHMALVIDEYGGVDGLVTIEDLVEPIVGDIEDEHDSHDGPMWSQMPDGTWLCDARAYLDAFSAATHVTLLSGGEEEEVDTLGGLILLLAGRVPERGEVISHPDGHEFEIIDADPRRVKRLRVRLQHADDQPKE